MDVHTKTQRRRNMAAIRQKDTKPELIVRRLLHRHGYRYRLHVRLCGARPDVVYRTRRKVIFVHGCFWHMHECRYGVVQPKTNAAFWKNKRETNVQRDREQLARLDKAGWQALVVWECETRDVPVLQQKLFRFLEGDRSEERAD